MFILYLKRLCDKLKFEPLLQERMSIELVLYTHSDYKDLWPILLDSLSQRTIQIPICFAMDHTPEDPRFEAYKVYLYDDTLTYPQRIASICKQISSDYLFFFHDIDVLVHFDQSRLETLMEWIEAMDVDRFALGIYPSSSYVTTYQDIPIAKLEKNTCDWFTSPYDPGPSIWKRKTFEEVMTQFSNETYRTIESSGIQDVLSTKNVFGFAKRNLYPLFTIGRPYTPWFPFCHVLIRGQWVCNEGWQSFESFMAILLDKYKIDQTKRGIAQYHLGMANGFDIA
jgi:hypothetical protein